jgi:DNA-binding response OmpR family regulator
MPPDSTAAGQKNASGKKRVLIVEDEHPLAHTLQMKFKNQGYDATVVMNGLDALEAIRNGAYDIILLDLVMPVMDGFVFMSEYRKEASHDVPILVLTNLDQLTDIHKAMTLGAKDFIVKAKSDLDQIIRKVGEILSGNAGLAGKNA